MRTHDSERESLPKLSLPIPTFSLSRRLCSHLVLCLLNPPCPPHHCCPPVNLWAVNIPRENTPNGRSESLSGGRPIRRRTAVYKRKISLLIDTKGISRRL